ncbi:23S rRNA pseudouridine(1911/1915/1917) synthase RluD [Uliginosibacterium sp. 31-16]|uniref:23S rRNA pseudouridine(1911/1915/1917) synthase RluD n=1 Tax=Uliginosibacterium sp. 31-16 TaxID=3068315 RepID=UPI00273EEB51|nr:23S rRNA pseudouridine(1911/1915/1917) synthase RluD [Uliginosibacterium sp. 31-16]MDP5241408.1 23S rRNA pseudouridine(1911/1915/1917) synthase RluD [Uliginosibacterium sp. 31-16]
MAGQRLDAGLAILIPEYSRSRLQGWIRAGLVQIDELVRNDPKSRLRGGESLLVEIEPDPAMLADAPEDIPLSVVFEDAHILVLNKPAGLVVHPGSGNWTGTLLNALLAHAPHLAEVPRAGIVHRLDKETSGLMVVAKTIPAQTDLVRQLQARTVKRHYAAVVMGYPPVSGTVDEPIDRHPTQRTKMAVVRGGREARTHFRLVERLQGASWIECVLDTGRTHQIRVHMAHIGHPLVGDPVYGGRKSLPLPAGDFPRQALHAFQLGLKHPATGEEMLWRVSLAADIEQLMERLRSRGSE